MDKRKLHAGIIAGTILAGVGIAHIFASSSNKKTSIPINHEPLFVDLRKMTKLAAHSNTNFKNFEKKYMINQRYVPQSEFCKNDVILSDKIKIAKETVKTKIGRNTIVIGNSGSGKSKLFVEPNIKFSNNSMVVVDQFGEFYKNNASDLEKRSYKVYRLDFNDSAETPDLSSINREKTAVFVTFPREEASTIISAFFGTLFDILFCDGNKQLNGKPYIGVDIFLDDWSISKNIPDLHTKIAICRVYNVGFFIILPRQETAGL
jgi:hypothetical protein